MSSENISFWVYCGFGIIFLVTGLLRLNASPEDVFRQAQRGARWRFGVEGGHPTPDFERRIRQTGVVMIIMAVVFFALAFALRPTSHATLTPIDGLFMTPTPWATASF